MESDSRFFYNKISYVLSSDLMIIMTVAIVPFDCPDPSVLKVLLVLMRGLGPRMCGHMEQGPPPKSAQVCLY